jgi:hypothetical protein
MMASLPGCDVGKNIDVTIKPLPEFTILETPEGDICGNISKKLKPSSLQSGVTYKWETPNGPISNQPVLWFTYHPTRWPSGLYTLIAEMEGCKSTRETTISFKPAPMVKGSNFYIVNDKSKPFMPDLSPPGGILESKYLKDGLLAPARMPKDISYFNYTVKGENGCTTQLYGQVRKISKSTSLKLSLRSSALTSVCANIGSTILTCTATPNVPLKYGWTMQRPGKPVVRLDSNQSKLTVSETATYCITATSQDFGNATSCMLITIWPELPKPIILQSKNCHFSTACLMAMAPSLPEAETYTWFRNGIAISGQTSSSLPFGGHPGVYSVRIATPCLGPISDPNLIPE